MKDVVAFIGKSDSGKTTVLEKVIAELTRRGNKVGVIKHGRVRFSTLKLRAFGFTPEKPKLQNKTTKRILNPEIREWL